MAQQNTKVVSLDVGKATRQDLKKTRNHEIISQCRKVFIDSIEPILSHFFEKADDELFALSDKAVNSNLQTLYFDAMRYVRKERETIKKAYLSVVGFQYDQFWQGKVKGQSVSDKEAFDEDNFELVENEVLEEDLAITTMVEKGNNRFHKSLYDLNLRFAMLLGNQEIDNEENPVAPAMICHGFESVIKPLTLELNLKLVIYKLFDGLVLSYLGNIYDELNTSLINAGVLPTISRRVNRDDALAASSEAPPNALHQIRSRPDDGASLEAFQAMQSLLGDWRAQLGIPATANVDNAGLNGEPAYQTAEVLQALSGLQQTDLSTVTGGDSYGEVKSIVNDQLKKLFANSGPRPLATMEEDIIDMVAMIFDFILDDKNLPDAVKALMSRLQIPIVKIAILEKSFFAKKTHPVRQLLNLLAKAGIGLDDESCNTSPVFVEIERIVNRILSEFNHDANLFDELLEEFQQFYLKDDQRTQIMEKRTQQVTQSKEQLLLAKEKVSYEIAHRLHGTHSPAIIRNFIESTWKDVLILCYLRKEKDARSWDIALLVINKLIWTTTPPIDLAEKKKKLEIIPRLLKDVRVGLETISYDPHQMAQVFRDLEDCHVAGLKRIGQRPEIDLSNEECSTMEEQLTPPGFAQQPMTENLGPMSQDSDSQTGVGDERLPSIEEQRLETITDQYMEEAEAINLGQWLELQDESGKTFRAKLSWKSKVTSLYVFVNRKGAKVAEKTLVEFAEELRQNRVRIIEDTENPLMDRALAALMATLRKPQPVEAVPA